jgi:Predicted dehydrogenases and related proteins
LSYLPAIAKIPGASISMVYDPDRKRVTALASEVDARVAESIDQLVNDPDVDGIVVATPNLYHSEAVLAAAAAGKHVLCEKPLATNLRDGREMIAACRGAGVVLQVGFNQRFWPQVRLARDWIDRGVVGTPQGFRSVYSEAWTAYPAATRYRYDLAVSGGASIIDLTIHRIDLARYLVGEISEVCAIVDHRVIPDKVDDNVWLLVKFASGASGVISSDRFSPMVSNATDVFGDLGTLHLSTETMNPFQSVPLAVSSSRPISELPDDLKSYYWPIAWWEGFQGGWITASPTRNSPYQEELLAFIEAAQTGSEPPVTGEDGFAALEVVLAAYKSVREHSWVRLPLKEDEVAPPEFD